MTDTVQRTARWTYGLNRNSHADYKVTRGDTFAEIQARVGELVPPGAQLLTSGVTVADFPDRTHFDPDAADELVVSDPSWTGRTASYGIGTDGS